MVVGIGIDIVEVERMERILARHGDRFVRRVFSEREAGYCRRSARPAQSFAARFAAKESVLKALGVGWRLGAKFTDVEVVNDDFGAPSIRLSGKAREISERKGVARMVVSLSHTRLYANALVIAESEMP